MKALMVIFMIWIAVLTYYVCKQNMLIEDIQNNINRLLHRSICNQDDIIRLIKRTNLLKEQQNSIKNILIQFKNQLRRRC